MKMSNSEKLITVMLCEIMEHLNINSEVDPDFVKDAILDDHLWAFEWKYHGIFGENGDPTPQYVSFVADVLDMWSFIERGYDNLSDVDKAQVKSEAPFGFSKFEGFDGNNETEYMSVARFLVEKLNRFTEFKGRSFNSHMPSVQRYREMLHIFEEIQNNLDARSLTAEEIIKILKRGAA
ncbi:hypothetical protein WJ15_04975 [Burkholderia cepacia]|uniref:YfbU family protein n=1 Tax=Burkholderia cepacia TaxID=292 RepID=UPI00075CEC77|nr:YfbU family protein [Burkholderia cepacia]KVF67331.1 hypothetical protein WJ15_04975 [Burkholderia cepacia]